ncbi:outer membrane lipoprotein-sorting protein [Winogradskyella sp.]|uniref:outer membrane lipoprotein-sorting protein n=1 Tax=Winogradskyella sp. TaxID=1883156 RepID=UPI002606498B|nr:outer membrane lipoprotein-sorting protein [Winogradskyella sp.]
MKTFFLAIAFTLAINPTSTIDDKGRALAQKSKDNDKGYESEEVELEMILTNKQGQVSKRYMKSQTLEVATDGDKSMIEFNSPKDVKGTKTLTFTHRKGDDDQWLFLPSINRVKRISSSNKSGPFVGSEFSFEDLTSFEVEKYTHKFVEETTLDGINVAVVEQVPLYSGSGYSKRLVYMNVDKDYRFEKIEYFDRKGAKLKTLVYKDQKQHLEKYWRPNELEMINHQNGKKTSLKFTNHKFKTGLTESDFTQSSLRN